MLTDESAVKSICAFLSSKKATDIKAYYVADNTIIADWFVICSGKNENHVKSLSDETDEYIAKDLGLIIKRSDGIQQGRWIVMDYGTILLHIFHPEERTFYNLDRLWDFGNNQLALDLEEE